MNAVMKFLLAGRQTVIKNGPMILTVLGGLGVVGTGITTYQATLKAVNIVNQTEFENQRQLTKKEVMRLCWPIFIPPIVTGAAAITCIFGANTINHKRLATIAGLYSASEVALKEFKNKAVEVVGEKKVKQIKDEMAKDLIEKKDFDDSLVVKTLRGDVLCYDKYSGRPFYSDPDYIRKVGLDLRDRQHNHDYVQLNDFYDALGLDYVKEGWNLGWSNVFDHGAIELDFSSQLTAKNEPCLVVDFRDGPFALPQCEFY